MARGSSIVTMASINAFVGRPDLLDYTTTKGAIVSFTRGLSNQVAGKGIRVNGEITTRSTNRFSGVS